MKYYNPHIKNIEAYKPGEQPECKDNIIKLNTNESPYAPSKNILKMLENFDISLLRLYPDPKAEKLCETIADKLNFSKDNIIATNGSDEVFTYIFNAFVSNEKNVIFTNPTYTVYESLAYRFNINFTTIETESDFSIDLSKVPNESNTVFFLANPNAQTGIYIDFETLENFIKQFKGLIIVDEAYIDFAPKGIISLALKYDNLIVTRTLSKSYSLCGIRLGFAASCSTNIEALHKVKDSYNINMLTQMIAIEAINDEKHMLENAYKIITERERMIETLNKMCFMVLPSKANFVLAKPLLNNAKDIFEALKKQNIYVRYFDTPRLKEYIRITIGSEKENNILIKELSKINNN